VSPAKKETVSFSGRGPEQPIQQLGIAIGAEQAGPWVQSGPKHRDTEELTCCICMYMDGDRIGELGHNYTDVRGLSVG
jgi:hypothetical protein